MIILDRAQIEGLIDLHLAAPAIEAAYIAASRGKVNLPPVGHITFPDLSADCHIKYGHQKGDPFFVIKVATGFPQNEQIGLSSGNGVSLVMSAQTGALQALLHDEMVMTDIRTGVGGAIATRCLARADSTRVLVVGTGPQAVRQIESHAALIGDHLEFEVWGRSDVKTESVVAALSAHHVTVVGDNLAEAVGRADIIITATGSTRPVIEEAWVRKGTHITAVGADAPGKQELETALVARADVLVADSIDQCVDHGEISHAFKNGLISRAGVVEIGAVLSRSTQGRVDDTQVTIADLTGIAAQDIAIAGIVLGAHQGVPDTHG